MPDVLDELLKSVPAVGGGDDLDALLASVPPARQAPVPTSAPMSDMGRWSSGAPVAPPTPPPPADKPGASTVQPIAPGKIPPTVMTSPVGKAEAPVPGQIPGMERLGGVAPGLPPVPNPMRPAPVAQPVRPTQNVQIQADEIPPPPAPVINLGKSGPVPPVREGLPQTFGEGVDRAVDYSAEQIPKFIGSIPKVQAMMRPGQTQVTPEEAVQAAQTVKEPLVRPDLLIPGDDGREDITREIARGALEAVGGMTSPENIGIIAATGGLGKVAQTVTSPAAAGALKAATTGLSLYFTGNAAVGGYQAGKTAMELYERGDAEGAARYLGLASVDMLFAALGTAHAASEAVGGAKSFKEGYDRGQRRRAAVEEDAASRFESAQQRLNAEEMEPIPGEPGKFRLKQRPTEQPAVSSRGEVVPVKADPLQQILDELPPMKAEGERTATQQVIPPLDAPVVSSNAPESPQIVKQDEPPAGSPQVTTGSELKANDLPAESTGGVTVSPPPSNQPVPAPGPREEVVQPVPVDAAAPVAIEPAKPAEVDPLDNLIEDAPPQKRLVNDTFMVPTNQLRRDPLRFQYKIEGVGKGGVSGKLKDVEQWNPDIAGTVFAWKDPADGGEYVVNGHHRHELAERLNVPDLRTQYIDAPDAKSARAAGALMNIGEGNGTAIDAAKFMRDTGTTREEMKAKGILSSVVAREGAALANLAPSLFDDVVHGNLKQNRAVIIGESLPDHADQMGAIEVLRDAEKRGKRLTDAEVRELIRRTAQAERTVEQQDTLFGVQEMTQNHALEEAQLSNFIRSRLGQEKKLFGLVGTKSAAERLGAAGNKIEAAANQEIAEQAAQVLAVYDKLSLSAGPISDALRDGARQVANGAKLDAVREQIYSSVRDSVSRLLGGKPAVREADARAEGSGIERGSEGVPDRRGKSSTVEQTPAGRQETLVTDLEARESQLAAKRDRTTPLAEVPFSLVQEEPPAPTGPDERQESMFDDSEIASYSPKNLQAKPGTPTPQTRKAARRPGAQTGKAVSRSEIVKNLSSFLNDIPIRTGGYSGKALGIFKTRQSVIRSRKALDLPTIAHEIGHAIHKYLWGTSPANPNKLNSRPLRPFAKELGALDYDPVLKRSFEGFAEYVRLRITDPAQAKRRAPAFHAWLETQLKTKPDLAKVLEQAQEQYRNWDVQPATVKMAASINVRPDVESFIDKAVSVFSDFRYNWIDEKADLEKAVDLFAAKGATVSDVENAYRLARMVNGTFTRAHYALTDATVGPDYKPNGAGLSSILKPIAKRPVSERNPKFQKLVDDWGIRLANDGMDDLRVHLVARRLKDYLKNGLEAGFTRSEVKEALDATTTPDIEAAATAIHDYQDRILQYVVDKGAMSKELAELIRSRNEFYVPLHRVMDTEEGAGGKNALGRAMIDLKSPIMARRGSDREIIDPLENIVRNTYSLMSFADRNNVAQALVKQAERVSDQGWLVESGIMRPMKATRFNLQEVEPKIQKILTAAGIDASGVDFDSMAAIYRQNMDPSRKDGIVRVIVDGVPQLFQMNKLLIRALDTSDKASADFFMKLLSGASGMLRFGATAGNPEFVLSNFLRDQFMAGIQSRNGYIPFISGMYGAFKMIADPKAVEQWALNGGATAAIMPLTRESLRLSVDKITKGKKDLILSHPAQIFPILRDVLTVAGAQSETSTRIAEYLLAQGRGKSEAEAAFDSRDVSLDFERMGKIAKTVNKIVPFFSVALNAMDRFAAMHNPRNPKAFGKALAIGFGGITLASLALWWLNRDDEEYKNVEDWKRDLYWLIPTKGLGLRKVFGPFIRIAKPPLWGQLYGSMFERWAASLYAHDKHAFDGFEKTLGAQVLPPFSVQTFRPIEEVYSNYNRFTDRPIESDMMKKLSPENRFNPGTSETAKAMSKGFNQLGMKLSPVQIDHLMLGYTAGLGRVAISSAEELAGARDNRPAMDPSERPILRALSTPENPYFSTTFMRFKNRLDELERKKNDAKFTKNPALRLTPQESAQLHQLSAIKKELAGLRSRQYAIGEDKSLSREAKREKIDALSRQREQILSAKKSLFN